MPGHGRNSYIADAESTRCIDWSSEFSESADPTYNSSQGQITEARPKQEIHVSVAEVEKKWVNRLKILVIVVLLTAVIATSFRIYVLLSNEEEEDFKIPVSYTHLTLPTKA